MVSTTFATFDLTNGRSVATSLAVPYGCRRHVARKDRVSIATLDYHRFNCFSSMSQYDFSRSSCHRIQEDQRITRCFGKAWSGANRPLKSFQRLVPTPKNRLLKRDSGKEADCIKNREVTSTIRVWQAVFADLLTFRIILHSTYHIERRWSNFAAFYACFETTCNI